MKRLLYTLLLTLFFALPAGASLPKTGIGLTNAAVRKVGDQVLVTFDIEQTRIPTRYSVTITPVLHSAGNERILPPVTLAGRMKYLADVRNENTRGERERIDRRSPNIYEYTLRLPYEEWMRTVSLSAVQRWGKCCSETALPEMLLAADLLLEYDIVPHYDRMPLQYELTELEKYDLDNPFLHPMEDYDKRYDILKNEREKGTSVVYFKVNSSVIDPAFEGNSRTLEAISRAFELIEADPNATLRHIVVAGYASPEGALAHNTRLAQNRAEAVKRYLQTRMRNPYDHYFEIYNGREDWEGLRQKVDKSHLPERADILRIIDSYTMEQQARKTALKGLAGGEPYRYMLANFYPALRNAGYVQVYYEIDRKAPNGTTYTDKDGRTTWIDTESEANYAVTVINAAVKLMDEGRWQEALNLMAGVKSDPRAFNPIGVCLMMTGDLNAADDYLKRARDGGDSYAPLNLNEIDSARKVR